MKHSDITKKYPKKGNYVVYTYKFDSPVGKIIASADDEYLYLVSFEDSKNLEKNLKSLANELSCEYLEKKNALLERFEMEIKQYFDGELKKFSVSIKTFGSEFQKGVWDELLKIPYGITQSYSDVAKKMGRPASHSRAVGAACGANGHLLVIPCHRVVATCSKGGFSCGVDRKEWLLQHEKKFVT